MPEEQLAIREKYLKYSTDYSDLADCDVVFECVTEVIGLKPQI